MVGPGVRCSASMTATACAPCTHKVAGGIAKRSMLSAPASSRLAISAAGQRNQRRRDNTLANAGIASTAAAAIASHKLVAVVSCQSIGAAASTVAKPRSEEHTSELQPLMRISDAVLCLKKKNK